MRLLHYGKRECKEKIKIVNNLDAGKFLVLATLKILIIVLEVQHQEDKLG